jgi:ABC-type polysaccharide/polyol phosphate transport system ATPase subunit
VKAQPLQGKVNDRKKRLSAAIRFERVSKRFILHRERPRSFQELAVNLFRRSNGSREEFWALRDASFAVEQGETVGIIGPNGAGKSTVLKLISRIIEPTSGRTEVHGRVGALLELGTGFHPDLTGRENIYLNGSILGLSRTQIRHKLDDMVAFAELERFIDVPVKHYSSGMYVRLGFSVAVHTEPQILLVDEVLAVGDQAFQAKCLDCIARMREQGATILLVSHGLDSVRRLCQRAIWLDQGQVQAIGPADDVVTAYLSSIWENPGIHLLARGDVAGRGKRWGSGEATITKVEFLDSAGRIRRVFQTGDPFVARIHYCAHRPIRTPAFGVAIYREDGSHVAGPNTVQSGCDIDVIDGEGTVDYVIESLPLLSGRYEFTAAIYDHNSIHPYDHQHRAYTFNVEIGATLETEGLVRIPCRWVHCRG